MISKHCMHVVVWPQSTSSWEKADEIIPVCLKICVLPVFRVSLESSSMEIVFEEGAVLNEENWKNEKTKIVQDL